VRKAAVRSVVQRRGHILIVLTRMNLCPQVRVSHLQPNCVQMRKAAVRSVVQRRGSAPCEHQPRAFGTAAAAAGVRG